MAVDPRTGKEIPDSVMLQKFDGIKNTVSTERLGPTDLERATNVDIDDAGMVRRRRGFTKVSTGDFHSVFNANDIIYGVKDGDLGIIYPDYSFASLVPNVGPRRIAHTMVDDVIYFSGETTSGKILPDQTVAPWGASTSAGTWLSPVVNPTSTLSPIKGKLLGAPPLATDLAYLNGRIYMANGDTIWATELYLYDYVDKTRTYMPFGDEVTGVESVTDGLYVGTKSAAYFTSGPLGSMQRWQVSITGVLPGSMIPVTADMVRPERNMSRKAVLYMTESGLCSGLDGGVTYNMTERRVIFPDAAKMAAMFRKQDGINQYVGVMDSAGTPSSAARVGDYVDAEIRRFEGA